jgi:glycosyltransferase involved in cell wall biosynthesis
MRVGMVGPGFEVQGGIVAVVREILGAPALNGLDVRYVASATIGSRTGKLRRIVGGEARFARLVASKPALVHLHVGAPVIEGRLAIARYVSFWRKMAFHAQARAAGVPVVLHLHGSDGLVALHDGSRAGRTAVEAALRSSAAVLTVSEKMAAVVRQWTDTPVEVLYNPVDTTKFAPTPLQDRPTVLFLGLIGQAKGVYDLLAAIPEVLETVPDARFVFGGNGEVEQLRAEARRLGVAHAVETPGWLAGDAKRRALESAWVFALPSYYEGLPVGVLEAMACGRPVVATDIAGIPEAVAHEQSGFLVRPGERRDLAARLTALLRDRVRSDAMGRAGRALAEARFSRDRVAGRLRAVWEKVGEDNRICR